MSAVQGQRISGGFILITGRDGIRYVLRPNQIVVIHDADECHELAEYHPPDNSPKLVAAVVDVETTGTNPDSDRIIELGICLFEYDRQSGRIYRVLGSWEWFEDPGLSIPPEVTKITGITDDMVAGHRIDDRAADDLLGRALLIIAHHADFDRRFLERRLAAFATKHWVCSRFDIDWKAEGIRSSALEFIAYSLVAYDLSVCIL
jgi:DNA polymerase-3 subunit epsilon